MTVVFDAGHNPLQWGRNFFVTEMAYGASAFTQILALQWGRNFFVTEIMTLYSSQVVGLTLQWGRNFFVTEICQTA